MLFNMSEWIQKIFAAIFTSAIGGGITIYFKFNIMGANMLEITAQEDNLLAITLVISGMCGLLTLILWPYIRKQSKKPEEIKEKHQPNYVFVKAHKNIEGTIEENKIPEGTTLLDADGDIKVDFKKNEVYKSGDSTKEDN